MQTSFTQTIKKRILKYQDSYDFDGAFDRVVRIRRLDNTMSEIAVVTILPFPDTINSAADMVPPSGSCYFRTNGNTNSVIINDDDTQAESAGITYLECVFVNTFCRATVDSTGNINALQAAERNASDGIRLMRVDDPSIDTVQGCLDAANALKAEFEKTPVTVNFRTSTRLTSGQTLTYTSPVDSTAFEVTITNVVWSLLGGEFIYDCTLQYLILKSPRERQKEALRGQQNPKQKRATIIDVDYPI